MNLLKVEKNFIVSHQKQSFFFQGSKGKTLQSCVAGCLFLQQKTTKGRRIVHNYRPAVENNAQK